MAAPQNHLLELLPARDRSRLIRGCETVELELSQILCDSGRPTRHVYFPVDGFVSLVTSIDGKSCLEVGMVGREGMLGSHVALGVITAPLRVLVQGAGLAWRMDTATFRKEMARSAALQRAVHRYIYVLMTQLASSAACLRFHQIGERLARWLLMTQDRAHADLYPVTHEFMAYMLGVRRVGVTNAAGELQREHLIEYHRGEMRVLDRRGLEAAACGCYAAERRAYARFFH